MGSDAEGVIRGAPVPVLLVHDAGKGAGKEGHANTLKKAVGA